ncbi:MAG: FKBP-type peptidyl-prolyl cis-trans isomerase [Chitinophagaceae bacterium]|nr:FKBP-type peptidyl-prolyl cis-trans isomerase [Chitinophagaceae bacterium]
MGSINKLKSIVAFIVVIALIAGCGNADYSKTKEGMVYRIIRSGTRANIKPRTYLKVHQAAYLKDSMLFTTFEYMPAYGFFDSLPQATHDFLDILDKMRVGDSAVVIRSIDTLFAKGMLQYNEIFKKGDVIKVYLKVLGTFKDEKEMEADRASAFEAYKQLEIKRLGEFVAAQNLKAEKLQDGIYLVVDKEGTGPKVDSGMYVKVKYTGRLKNGNVFDSNVDSAFGHTEPFEFVAGTRQVIAGWDVAIQKLKVGSKARVFIPSSMGYGMQSQGAKLPAYSDLIFDLEVLSVAEKHPDAMQPAAPGK